MMKQKRRQKNREGLLESIIQFIAVMLILWGVE